MTHELQPIESPSWGRETEPEAGRWHWLAHERWTSSGIAGYESICGVTMPRDAIERSAQLPDGGVCGACAALSDRPPGAGRDVG